MRRGTFNDHLRRQAAEDTRARLILVVGLPVSPIHRRNGVEWACEPTGLDNADCRMDRQWEAAQNHDADLLFVGLPRLPCESQRDPGHFRLSERESDRVGKLAGTISMQIPRTIGSRQPVLDGGKQRGDLLPMIFEKLSSTPRSVAAALSHHSSLFRVCGPALPPPPT
ncbi:MAG: hypothetical protein OJF50_005323 [Nitrospira sp.]|nr:hypothetical protein [Nitrospira sp.]